MSRCELWMLSFCLGGYRPVSKAMTSASFTPSLWEEQTVSHVNHGVGASRALMSEICLVI